MPCSISVDDVDVAARRVHAERVQQPRPADGAGAVAPAAGARQRAPARAHAAAPRRRRPAGPRVRRVGALPGREPRAAG